MTVVAMESLPLGFRFRPTDEELVNHYLKHKISGNGSPDVHVIPEVDVSKCEPWDLPDKSLIKSDDLEWFFFAPIDRKYPNGHRSNRATAAGYWKATGKDRIIRSRSGEKNQLIVIGIKKTLVFHTGRAPRGVRTGWIMHEYRTTEPEYESGKQGGYVLYRLFNKEEERASPKDENENDETISSPVGETQNDEAEPKVNLLEDCPTSSGFTDRTARAARLDKCFADLADSSVAPSIVTPSAFDEGSKGTQEDEFMQLTPVVQLEHLGRDGFPNISSPLRPYTDHPFPNSLNQEEYSKFLDYNTFSNPELVDNLLDSVLPNPHNYSATNQQDTKDNEVMYWPYEQLQGADAYLDNSNYGINESIICRVPEGTGITALGREMDENPKRPLQPPQGTAKRRIGLGISEFYGRSCTVTNRNENEVLQPEDGDAFLAEKLEDLQISGVDDAETDKEAKAEVMSRDKLSRKGDNQPKGGGTPTGMIRYNTRFALCVILISVCFGIWRTLNRQEA